MNKLKSFVSTAVDVSKHLAEKGELFSDSFVAKERWSICQGCPKLEGSTCKECGCYMKVKVKVLMANCPKGKW